MSCVCNRASPFHPLNPKWVQFANSGIGLGPEAVGVGCPDWAAAGMRATVEVWALPAPLSSEGGWAASLERAARWAVTPGWAAGTCPSSPGRAATSATIGEREALRFLSLLHPAALWGLHRPTRVGLPGQGAHLGHFQVTADQSN